MDKNKVIISPKILKWARTSLHLTEDDVVDHFSKKSKQKFNLDLYLLQKIESKENEIKFSLLQELAFLYRRPLSVFFLSAPPHELLLPKDRRTIGSFEHNVLSPETVLIFRRAAYVQEIFSELATEFGYNLKIPFKKISLSDNPKEIAKKFREYLDFSFELQKDKIKDPKNLFDIIREKLEAVNVFTMKASFPLEDARAFSLVDRIPNIVVINNRDGGYFGYAPKAFSLLHEFAHVLLREGGICNDFFNSHVKIEKFCNEFAASFLVPDDTFLNVLGENNLKLEEKEIEKSLELLTKIFKVSKYVLLRKSLENELIKEDFYKYKVKNWKDDYDESAKGKGKFVPKITPGLRTIKNNSTRFVDTVLLAKSSGKITLNNTADYLGVGIKWIPEIEFRIQKG